MSDGHEHDALMPGFRFHPTEEELIEFYLRRKVQGKRFNVELITFLDLYRYDPWELPALAAIGEKEWFFYVPRDRKYRNGDRPNRVTASGYWKATGADRVIQNESSRSIGLKKTLVFYTGKAPKGVRTSWIMNEYRLPHCDPNLYRKVEISVCRVYKRAGVEDHPRIPGTALANSRHRSASSSLPRGTATSTLIDKKLSNYSRDHHKQRPGAACTFVQVGKEEHSSSPATNFVLPSSSLTPAKPRTTTTYGSAAAATSAASLSSTTTSTEEDGGGGGGTTTTTTTTSLQQQYYSMMSNGTNSALCAPACSLLAATNHSSSQMLDELNRLVSLNNYNQSNNNFMNSSSLNQQFQLHLPGSQAHLLPFTAAFPVSLPSSWDWSSSIPQDTIRGSFYTDTFK